MRSGLSTLLDKATLSRQIDDMTSPNNAPSPPDARFQIKVGLDVEGAWKERPLDFLTQLTKCMNGLVQTHLQTAVETARAQGHTWGEIGKALGVSRQAAWGRFADGESPSR